MSLSLRAFLTKPSLLLSLHLDSKAKVCQLHRGSLHLTGQQQVLGLTHIMKQNVGQETKTEIITGTRKRSRFVEMVLFHVFDTDCARAG